MEKIIDICSDLGEGFGHYSVADDESIIKLISSANVACGFHAGDPRQIYEVVKSAINSRIGIGAHPGYPDLRGFGRRNMDLTYTDVYTDVLYQLGAVDAFVRSQGGKLQHIFPHGQLGLRANVDKTYAEAIIDAVLNYDLSLIVITQSGVLSDMARKRNLKVAVPIFADRAYNDDGSLVSRSLPNSVIHDPDEVISRSIKMVLNERVTSITGKEIEVKGHTLLIHGDTEGSLELANRINLALKDAKVNIKPLGEWL